MGNISDDTWSWKFLARAYSKFTLFKLQNKLWRIERNIIPCFEGLRGMSMTSFDRKRRRAQKESRVVEEVPIKGTNSSTIRRLPFCDSALMTCCMHLLMTCWVRAASLSLTWCRVISLWVSASIYSNKVTFKSIKFWLTSRNVDVSQASLKW